MSESKILAAAFMIGVIVIAASMSFEFERIAFLQIQSAKRIQKLEKKVDACEKMVSVLVIDRSYSHGSR